jgi:putative hydrolase of HD superfamily
MDAPGLLAFFRVVGELKRVPRSGWRKRGIQEGESVAEHSYRTAVLAAFLCGKERGDLEKTVKMALLHDLPEARTGDIARGDLEVQEKEKREGEAMREILGPLPPELREECLGLWEEYRRGKTPEARSVKEADRLELLLQAEEYEREGYSLDDFWEEKYAFEGIFRELYELLKAGRRGETG